MILSETGIQKIMDKEVRRELQEHLDVTDQTLYKWRKKNDPNGPLTGWLFLKVIKDCTGLTDEDLLIDEKEWNTKKQKAVSTT
jgi:hypothetical protein